MTELDLRGIDARRKALPLARFGRGYRIAEVDQFLDRTIAAIRTRLAENEGLRAGVAPDNLWFRSAGATPTPPEVDAQMFELARFGGGYRIREVDDLLDEVAYLVAQLDAESEALRARSASG